MSQRRVVGKHLILGQSLFKSLVRDEEGRRSRRTAEADTSYTPIDAFESARAPEAC